MAAEETAVEDALRWTKDEAGECKGDSSPAKSDAHEEGALEDLAERLSELGMRLDVGRLGGGVQLRRRLYGLADGTGDKAFAVNVLCRSVGDMCCAGDAACPSSRLPDRITNGFEVGNASRPALLLRRACRRSLAKACQSIGMVNRSSRLTSPKRQLSSNASARSSAAEAGISIDVLV